jgi:hypothetical protein
VYAAVDKLASAMHELSRGHEEPVRGTCRLLLNLFAAVVRELSTAGAAQQLLELRSSQELSAALSCWSSEAAGAQKLSHESSAAAQEQLELRSSSGALNCRSSSAALNCWSSGAAACCHRMVGS